MIVIDLNYINEFINQFANLSEWQIVNVILFKYWSWVLFVYFFLRYLVYPEYMLYIQNRWVARNFTFTLLAIDVPKRNEQSVQAMENFFDHLQGAHATITLWEKYIEGVFQLSFSCELVSIEGNVQFIVRTPTHWRKLVETAVYGQYPDAEITEVNDYTGIVPRDYPNETHDIWGCEFTLSNDIYLPIKTYLKFEHRFSEVFVDPMAALLETLSQIGPGEHIWIQILLRPLEVMWGQKEGRKYINKVMGVPETPPEQGLAGAAIDKGFSLLGEITEHIIGSSVTGETVKSDKERPLPSRMLYLSPLERERVELAERKISKLAFGTKIRFLYIAEKKRMNKAVGVNAMIGAIKQWTDMNANGLKPDLKTTGTNSPQYILINYRRNSRRNWLLGGYIQRDMVRGSVAKPMCSEELASLWHFPSMYVKAPLLKKTDFIKVAAPVGLPFEERVPQASAPAKEIQEVIAEKTQVIPTFDYDSNKFEMQFAKDKQEYIKTLPEKKKKEESIAKEEEVKLKTMQKEEAQSAQASAKAKVEKPVEAEKKTPGNLPFID